jgi:hypothetical protein
VFAFDPGDLFGGQFVSPAARLATPEEVSTSVRAWRLAEAFFLFLALQLSEISQPHGSPNFVVRRNTFRETQGTAQCSDRIEFHVFIANEMNGDVGLLEPGGDMSAPTGKVLAELFGLSI